MSDGPTTLDDTIVSLQYVTGAEAVDKLIEIFGTAVLAEHITNEAILRDEKDAPYDMGRVSEAVTELISARTAFIHLLYEQRVVEAVAAEREAIIRMLDAKADEWSRIAHDDPAPELDLIATGKHDAYREAAHLVYARSECEGRPE